jgi:hypothetical protein
VFRHPVTRLLRVAQAQLLDVIVVLIIDQQELSFGLARNPSFLARFLVVAS